MRTENPAGHNGANCGRTDPADDRFAPFFLANPDDHHDAQDEYRRDPRTEEEDPYDYHGGIPLSIPTIRWPFHAYCPFRGHCAERGWRQRRATGLF